MGCDGGTIPRRDELVRLKKKPEQKDKEAELSFKWRHCALSQQPLQEPIVACGLGRLYSKSAVIEALLDKATIPESARHIKNLKDVRELRLAKNPAYRADAEKTDGAIDERGAPYVCPVIGLEMSGRFRFVFAWSCGCAMSERAFNQVKGQSALCHLCMEPFSKRDVVVINGSDEDVDKMRENMAERQAEAKASKKSKKGKEAAPKVKEEEAGPSTSMAIAVEVKSSKRSCTSKIEDPVYKKAKQDYSVAKDPKATDVFKSLFTSHASDKTQQRAHWITYNPFYN